MICPDPFDPLAVDHRASCLACRRRVADHDALVAALRVEPAPIDDVTRARVLARLAPELDVIAARRGARARPAWFLAVAGVAAAVAVVIATSREEAPTSALTIPSPVERILDRDVLRPYEVTGVEAAATVRTLLAGRFSSLEVAAGQTIHATVAGDATQVEMVGPTRVVVADVGDQIALDVDGTVIVRGTLELRARTHVLHATRATFAARTNASLAVHVERGEVVVDGRLLRAGDSLGDTRTLPGRTTTAVAPPVTTPTPARRRAAAREPVPAIAATPDVVNPAAALYARAEAALRAGDRGAARARWDELVAAYPGSSHVPLALYELALLHRATDPSAARTYLARALGAAPPAAIIEPARYLACRLEVEAGDLGAAARCFETFRRELPRSSRDAEILAWLAGDAERRGGCATARGLARDYLARYPAGSFAARARRCVEAP